MFTARWRRSWWFIFRFYWVPSCRTSSCFISFFFLWQIVNEKCFWISLLLCIIYFKLVQLCQSRAGILIGISEMKMFYWKSFYWITLPSVFQCNSPSYWLPLFDTWYWSWCCPCHPLDWSVQWSSSLLPLPPPPLPPSRRNREDYQEKFRHFQVFLEFS